MNSNKNKRRAGSMFLRSMLFTAAAIMLLLIGYFCAGFFFGRF